MKVLIAEDDPSTRFLLVHAARRKNMDPIEAVDGADAIKKLLENPDIKALLSDGVMPKVSGEQLIAWVKDNRPEIFCVFSSGTEIICHQADWNLPKPQGVELFQNLKHHLSFSNPKLNCTL